MLGQDLKTLSINLLSGFAVYILGPVLALIAVGASGMFELFADQLSLMRWVGPAVIFIGFGIFCAHYVTFIMRFDKQLAALAQRLEDLQPSRIAVTTEPADVEQFKQLTPELEAAKMARSHSGFGRTEADKKLETSLFARLQQLGIARSDYADSKYGSELMSEYWRDLQHLSEDGTAATLEHARGRWPLRQTIA